MRFSGLELKGWLDGHRDGLCREARCIGFNAIAGSL